MLSKETKRMRKALARDALRTAYTSTAAGSTQLREEAAMLKGSGLVPHEGCYGHASTPVVHPELEKGWDKFKAALLVAKAEAHTRIAALRGQRLQRAHYLRHLHLARAFLRGVPYDVVEQCPALHNSGWRGPTAPYIADIINGQSALAEVISEAEVTGWLNDNMMYRDFTFAREFFSVKKLQAETAREEARRFSPAVAN